MVELVIRETGLGGVFDFIIAQEDVERLKTQLLQDPLAILSLLLPLDVSFGMCEWKAHTNKTLNQTLCSALFHHHESVYGQWT
ncbi:MAG: hypothetical protein DRN90_01685 [Thermoproteota archaeon]|nr:MAG: hypothetical protein DRN90_01685 [Candidatus Korarchaeota archaeon]